MVIIQIVLAQLNDKQKGEYKFESETVVNKLLGKPPPSNSASPNFKKDLVDVTSQMINEMLHANQVSKEEEKKEASSEDKTKASDLKAKDNFGTFACNFRVAYIAPKINTEKFVSSSISMFVKQFASSNNSFEAIDSKGIEFKNEDMFSK
ncbi:MAG TPA: hypothetical protein P5052_04195 [Candidatus Paceibacterota bacterium]|jgi:hypothetical protein|nr:hypothetical protein [Candidatus Paceibacterota bacterium]HRZ29909.1 hypothetical protein [Candidatus Paceibacterota bacterium]